MQWEQKIPVFANKMPSDKTTMNSMIMISQNKINPPVFSVSRIYPETTERTAIPFQYQIESFKILKQIIPE